MLIQKKSHIGAHKILIVDDDPEGLFALEQLLLSQGFQVCSAGSGAEALEKALTEKPEIIVTDVSMPGMDGMQLTRQLKSGQMRSTAVILLTANSSLPELVAGLDAGADGFIAKPYQSDELVARVRAAVRTRELYLELAHIQASLEQSQQENIELKRQARSAGSFAGIVGKSEQMQQIFSLLHKVKDASAAVLISGESGTGKELVARAVHYNSNRADKPFIAQNCAAFNEQLLESELFGHVRGAFTGAVRDKKGLFEAANGGTFFLDELGEMSLALQVKLLRVLQDGTFLPVGATESKKVDVRIVAATNRNLQHMMQEGRFREDLYYRLNVINIVLPALRERVQDIPELAQHFLKRALERNKRESIDFADNVISALVAYRWPGNIRELENEVERAVLMSQGSSKINLEHLSAALATALKSTPASPSGDGMTLPEAIARLEQQMIVETLDRLEGNKSEAARILGISRSSLIAKAQQYGRS